MKIRFPFGIFIKLCQSMWANGKTTFGVFRIVTMGLSLSRHNSSFNLICLSSDGTTMASARRTLQRSREVHLDCPQQLGNSSFIYTKGHLDAVEMILPT